MDKIAELVTALNAEYTKRGINGVAVAIQLDPFTRGVKASFDTHEETYAIFHNPITNATDFLRVYFK